MKPTLPQVLALARISALVGLRDEKRLRRALQTALRQRIPASILRETILQAYLFAGYAAAINAFHVLNELIGTDTFFLREQNGTLRQWKTRGRKLCRVIYDDQYERLRSNMKRLHPDLEEWMIWEGYGKVLSRPFLAPRVRELLIVAMTATLGVKRQFHAHVRGALHVGAAPSELRAVFRYMMPLMQERVVPSFRDILERLLANDAS